MNLDLINTRNIPLESSEIERTFEKIVFENRLTSKVIKLTVHAKRQTVRHAVLRKVFTVHH